MDRGANQRQRRENGGLYKESVGEVVNSKYKNNYI
jgi:hypothetical protein